MFFTTTITVNEIGNKHDECLYIGYYALIVKDNAFQDKTEIAHVTLVHTGIDAPFWRLLILYTLE